MVLPYLKGFVYFLCSMNGLVYSWLFPKYICRSIEVFNIQETKFLYVYIIN
jgi:hypothetical protein